MGTWADGTTGLVVLPDGRRVRGRGLRTDPPIDDEPPEFGVYLTGTPYASHHWPSVWIRWPDFRLPTHRAEALDVLRRAHELAGEQRVEVACRGGVGRTGTAVALLARLSGVPASEAVSWTRVHFRGDAVETPWQRRFVRCADVNGVVG